MHTEFLWRNVHSQKNEWEDEIRIGVFNIVSVKRSEEARFGLHKVADILVNGVKHRTLQVRSRFGAY